MKQITNAHQWAIDQILNLIFSIPSLYIHSVWFAWEFLTHQDLTLFTNLISIEAIYIGLLIGISQKKHIIHHVKKLITHLEK